MRGLLRAVVLLVSSQPSSMKVRQATKGGVLGGKMVNPTAAACVPERFFPPLWAR